MPADNEWVSARMMDDAIAFALENERANDWCRRMAMVFRAKGYLTHKQALVLLEIKAGWLRHRKWRR